MFGFIQKYKLLIIIAIFVLLGAAAYQFVLIDDDGDLIFLAKSSGVSGATAGNEIIELLDELVSININDDIFDDPVFTSLTDFQRGIGRESIGRSNPFAPLGFGGGAVGFIELPLTRPGDSSQANPPENSLPVGEVDGGSGSTPNEDTTPGT